MGLDSRSSIPTEEFALILKRLFRMVVAALLGRAWSQKSNKWLSLAGVVVLFRFLDRGATRLAHRAKKRST